MSDATKLMGLLFDAVVKYRDQMQNKDGYDEHLVKAGGMIAVAGLMRQLQIPSEHAERMYLAAVNGMAAEARKIKGES